MSRRGGRILAVALLATLFASSFAIASEGPSREEYVSTLERICKPRALATQRVMKGARADLSAERWQVVAHKFARATALFDATVKGMSPVTRPSNDVETLHRWFHYLKRQEDYLKRITAQVRARHAIAAQRLVARFIHNGNLANNVVIGFGFNYCRFKFSRYG